MWWRGKKTVTRVTASFWAEGGDDHAYLIEQHTEFHPVDDGAEESVGKSTLKTGDEPVRRLAKGKYEVIVSGLALTSDDPEAL